MFLIYYKWIRNTYFLNKFGEKISCTILYSVLIQTYNNNAHHILIKGVSKFTQDLNFMPFVRLSIVKKTEKEKDSETADSLGLLKMKHYPKK